MAQTGIHVAKSELSYSELLGKYAEYFSSEDCIPSGSYELNGTIPEALTKYEFEKYFDNMEENSDDIAFAALDFVCDHFGHDGCNGHGFKPTIEGEIEFCETHNLKMNCRGLSMLLASVLRIKGIKARHITCAPYEEPFDDCHVVVDCLLPSGKRIMLDPTVRLYYTDKNGEYVSLQRLREILTNGEELHPNAKASYNGGAFDAEENREYMTKNTFRFFRGNTFAEGIDEHFIDLIPVAYKEKQLKCRSYTVNDDAFWKM